MADQQLAMLVIVDTRTEEKLYASYYNPTTEEIIRACKESGIPHEPILNTIAEKRPEVHTLYIVVEKYLEAHSAHVTHSCSCHAKGEGPCGICQELGCELIDPMEES